MYTIDDRDQVVQINELPQSSAGAPCPVVLYDEHSLVVAYYVQETPQEWDGITVRIIGPESEGEPVAVVRFNRCIAVGSGWPNDEVFSAHPLASRGLRPYSASIIEHSSWLRELERRNSIHVAHKREHFCTFKHFVLAFHDSTLECLAESYDIVERRASIHSLIAEMASMLHTFKLES